MADLLTYNDGEWIPREDLEIEDGGSFEEAIGASLYRDGNWDNIFAPELLHREKRYSVEYFGGSERIYSNSEIQVPQQFTLSQWYQGNSDEQIEENIYTLGWISRISFTQQGSGGNPRSGILIRDENNDNSDSFHTGIETLDGKPHLLTCTVNTQDNIVKVYIDGELELSETDGLGGDPEDYIYSRDFIDGGWGSGYGTFTGKTDDSRLYDRILSDQEVKSIYNGERVVNGLVCWWKKNEGRNNIVDDKSGNNNYGELSGGPEWANPVNIVNYESEHQPVNAYTSLDADGNIIGQGGIYGTLPYKTEGLVLCLDAGRRESYPGYGKTWYDISGNDHHAKGDPDVEGSGYDDDRFPVWEDENHGRFYFDGNRGLNIESDMGEYDNGTHEAWLYRTDLSNSTRYWADARNGTGSWWLTNYDSQNINISRDLQANDPPTYQSDSNWWDRWIHIVVKGNSDNKSKLYINGEQIDDERLEVEDPVNFNLGENFRIGNRYTSSSRWEGYMALYNIYDHELTENEIQNNYNNTVGRYQ